MPASTLVRRVAGGPVPGKLVGVFEEQHEDSEMKAGRRRAYDTRAHAARARTTLWWGAAGVRPPRALARPSR